MSAHNVYYVKYNIRTRNPTIVTTLPHEIHRLHLVLHRLLTRLYMTRAVFTHGTLMPTVHHVSNNFPRTSYGVFHKLLRHAYGALDRRWVH